MSKDIKFIHPEDMKNISDYISGTPILTVTEHEFHVIGQGLKILNDNYSKLNMADQAATMFFKGSYWTLFDRLERGGSLLKDARRIEKLEGLLREIYEHQQEHGWNADAELVSKIAAVLNE